jgi:hypothetical protein
MKSVGTVDMLLHYLCTHRPIITPILHATSQSGLDKLLVVLVAAMFVVVVVAIVVAVASVTVIMLVVVVFSCSLLFSLSKDLVMKSGMVVLISYT